MRAKAKRALLRFTGAAIDTLRDDEEEFLQGGWAAVHCSSFWPAMPPYPSMKVLCTPATCFARLPSKMIALLLRLSVTGWFTGGHSLLRLHSRPAGANWEAVAAYVDISQALKKFDPPAEPEAGKGGAEGACAGSEDTAASSRGAEFRTPCSLPDVNALLLQLSPISAFLMQASHTSPAPPPRPPPVPAALTTRKSIPHLLLTPLRAPVDLALSPFMHANKEAAATPAADAREPSGRGRSVGGGLAAIGGMLRSMSHKNLAETDRSTRSRMGRRNSRGSHRGRSRSRSRRGRFSDTDSGGESGGLTLGNRWNGNLDQDQWHGRRAGVCFAQHLPDCMPACHAKRSTSDSSKVALCLRRF